MSATPPKSSEDQREAPIEIVAYDRSWPSRFQAERLLLEEALLERLVFRDALRGSAKLAAQYGELKARLARQYRHDREAYTEAKAPFVSHVLSAIEAHKTSAT